MKDCNWEKVNDFRDFDDFNRFVKWIEEQVKSGIAEEVYVKIPYGGSDLFQERWFRHIKSGTIWRLVWPDARFTGIFEKVSLPFD